jgi:hypothetical protein
MYKIKQIQIDKANKIGVKIKPSENKKKKVDVFKNGLKVGSIGAMGYKDYGTYLEELPKKEADKKRKNYLARHSKEPKTKDGKKTNSYFADKILW